jgi:hypothetical protein
MPLTRASMTIAQRVMTVANTALAAAFGYGYVFEADTLRHAAAYRSIDRLIPLEVQGVGYLGIALCLGVGLAVRSRRVHVAGLAWLMAWTVILAGLLVAGWLRHDVTFLAWVLPAYVAVACWASMLSLVAQEA